MTFRLALVTGASSGIGQALSHRLDREGIPQIVVGRDQGRLEALVKTCRGPVEPLCADLSKDEGLAAVVATIESRKPDLVVNNAGSGLYGPIVALTIDKQRELIRLNIEALTVLTATAARELKKQQMKGCILNISSVAAYLPFPNLAAYAASKAFVNLFSESAAYELEGSGIDVLVACPGQVATRFSSRAAGLEGTREASGLVMSAEDAAEHLWWQLRNRSKVRLFDWRYRLLTWLATHLVPRAFVARFLGREINQRRSI